MITSLRQRPTQATRPGEAQPSPTSETPQKTSALFLPTRALKAAVGAATLAALCAPARAQSGGSLATGLATGLLLGGALDDDGSNSGPISKGEEIAIVAVVGGVLAVGVGLGLWICCAPACARGIENMNQGIVNTGRAIGRSFSAVYQGVTSCCLPRSRGPANDVEMGRGAPTRPQGAAPTMPMPLDREPMAYSSVYV